MTTALVDDLNPEVELPVQLALSGEAFEIARGLADAGAVTLTSLTIDDPSFAYEKAELLASYFGAFSRMTQWWVGDLLVFAEGAYGQEYAQLAHATGLSEQTLLNRAYVCRHVPREIRKPSLSFSMHADVAALPRADQKRWLDRAEKKGWNRQALRDAMKAKRRDERPTLVDPDEPGGLQEVAAAILRDAREHDDGQHFLVPNEDIVRLRAALGAEDPPVVDE